jgi:hypothetical protein
MAGYANRTVMLDFPDLSEDGDRIHVVIKNPKVVPLAELRPQNVTLGPDGNPNEDEAESATYRIIAGLVKAWHVYDATSLEEDQPELALPATPESVAKLPMMITERIAEEIAKVVSPGN